MVIYIYYIRMVYNEFKIKLCVYSVLLIVNCGWIFLIMERFNEFRIFGLLRVIIFLVSIVFNIILFGVDVLKLYNEVIF